MQDMLLIFSAMELEYDMFYNWKPIPAQITPIWNSIPSLLLFRGCKCNSSEGHSIWHQVIISHQLIENNIKIQIHALYVKGESEIGK